MTTITLRSVAGRPLSNNEVDTNFSNLNDFKVEQTAATGAAQLPSGSTAQRPGTPAAGYIRYNATTGKFEGYGSAWGNIGGGAFIGDTAPANPGAGDLWWNSATGHTFVYYGSAWVDLFGGAEGQYLPLTGGTISGNLAYTGTLTGGTGVINIGSGQFYKDAAGNVGIGTATAYGKLTISQSGSAPPVIFSANSNGTYPTTSNFGGSIDYNFSSGQAEVGFWNTYISASTSFVFRQLTGAASKTDLLSFAIGKTIALQGASTVSGTGISFPSTQSASSDANTLDDYEEGTWTPVLTGSVSNPTIAYSVQYGYYTKIGDTVTAHVNLQITSRSGGSGSVQISLPFQVTNANQFLGQGALEVRGVTFSSGYTYGGTLSVYGNGAKINLRQYGSGQAEIDIDVANLSTGAVTVRFTAVYKV